MTRMRKKAKMGSGTQGLGEEIAFLLGDVPLADFH